MKKLLLILIVFFSSIIAINAQELNQAANWPNTNWTLTGTYNAGALLANPTIDSNFSYDDDGAGSGSTDEILVTSPSIDLTNAFGVGETLLTLSYDYNYNLHLNILRLLHCGKKPPSQQRLRVRGN